MSCHAFIVGGTGQIGRAVTGDLLEHGWHVTVSHRGNRPLPNDLVERGANIERPFILDVRAAGELGYSPATTYADAVKLTCNWLVETASDGDWRGGFQVFARPQTPSTMTRKIAFSTPVHDWYGSGSPLPQRVLNGAPPAAEWSEFLSEMIITTSMLFLTIP